MAVINLTLDEILRIAESNIEFPKQITDIRTEGDTIILSIDPGKFVPGFKTVLKYDSFKDGKIHFKVQANPLLKLLMNFIDSLGNDKIELNQDVVSISVNEQLSKRVKGIQVTDITYKSDMFSIYIN